GYTGTITQGAGYTVDIGSSDYIQYNGTFTGGNSNFTVTDSQFALVGGTFTAPSATLKFQKTTEADAYAFQHLGGTFNHNSGTVWFDYAGTVNRNYFIDGNGSTTFNHLRMSSGHATTGALAVWHITGGETLIAQGNFALDRSAATGYAILSETAVNGILKVRGNVSFPTGSYGGTATVELDGTGAQTYSTDQGGLAPYLKINKTAGTVTPAAGTNDINVTHFILSQGSFTAPPGAMLLAPGVWWNGDATIFSVAAGTTFTHNNTTLVLYGQAAANATYTLDVPTSLTIHELTVDGGRTAGGAANTYTLGAGDSLTVSNLRLRQSQATGSVALNGSYNVTGNLTVEAGFDGGTAALTMNGTAAQTISRTGGTVPTGTFTINKTAGTASLASNFALSGASQNMVVNDGNFDLAGYNLTVSGTLTQNTGSFIRVQGGETVTLGAFNPAGGTVNYTGNGTYGSLAFGHTYNNLTFSGSGSWTHAAPLTVNNNVTVQLGATLISNGQNMTVGGGINVDGTYTSGNNTVTLNGNNQTLRGNLSFYNLTKSVTAPRTLTFEAGKMFTITNALTLQGTAGNLLSLRSLTPGTAYNINPQGTRTIGYLDVQDANNVNASVIDATAANATDSGNNTGWIFVTLDAFAIAGATGGTDTTADSWLGTTTTLTASWATASNAYVVTYDVAIRNSADTDYAEAGDTAGCTASTNALSYTFAGCTLTDGTSYLIQVTARVGSTTKTASNNSYSFTVDTTAPAAFTVSGIRGGTDVTTDSWLTNGSDATVYWNDTTGETGYYAGVWDTGITANYCEDNSSGANVTNVALGSCALVNGTTYTAIVIARDAAGNERTATLNFTVDTSAPAAFTITGATGGTDVTADNTLTNGTTVTANWNDTTGETAYDVVIRDSTNSADSCTAVTGLAADSTSHQFSGCSLTLGSWYKIKVTARDAAGNSTTAALYDFFVGSAASLSFDNPAQWSNVQYLDTSDVTFTITNSGSMNATGVAFSGLAAPFSHVGGTCGGTINGSSTCTYIVRFTSPGQGTYTDDIVLDYNNGSAQQITKGLSAGGVVKSVPVAALYSNGTNWNDYVKNDGADVYHASNVACDVNAAGLDSYFDCIHGGEKRKIELTGTNSCTGLVINEAGGAFDWICSVEGGVATYMTVGLKSTKGLADLINAGGNGWANNVVTISNGTRNIYRTNTSDWWSNAVVPLPDNSSGTVLNLDGTDSDAGGPDGTYSAGTIFTLLTSRATPGYNLNLDGMGVVVKSPAVLSWNGSATSSCSSNTGEVAAADRRCIVAVGGQNFTWIEGEFDGEGGVTDAQRPFTLNYAKFAVARRAIGKGSFQSGYYLNFANFNLIDQVTTHSNQTNGNGVYDSDYNTFRNITSYSNTGNGFELRANSDYNTVDGLTVYSNGGDGLYVVGSTSAGNTVNNLLSYSNTGHGIYLGTVTNGSITNAKCYSNGGRGMMTNVVSGYTFQ
ncbi:MAG TPA: right-handed parallel beta-helix repeat-containing protein, partial [Bdellovibrionales bacterium]|nr:right-handed parallel beta-helix repeat-containing protein [Bdellovibrionales bacterium]